MAKNHSELKDQVEAIRQEAYDRGRADGYDAGYSAALDELKRLGPKAITEPASAGAREKIKAALPTPRGATLITAEKLLPTPRGVTLITVEKVLQSAAPRALSQTQIVQEAVRQEGVQLAETSVRRALDKLVESRIAEQVGESKTWRAVSKLRSVS